MISDIIFYIIFGFLFGFLLFYPLCSYLSICKERNRLFRVMNEQLHDISVSLRDIHSVLLDISKDDGD